jgi:hypothetical protein
MGRLRPTAAIELGLRRPHRVDIQPTPAEQELASRAAQLEHDELDRQLTGRCGLAAGDHALQRGRVHQGEQRADPLPSLDLFRGRALPGHVDERCDG